MPIKQLKAFRRLSLAKGEKQPVELTIDTADLRYWDDKTASFVTPKGKYQLMVGSSSADIRLTTTITLE